MGRIPLLKVIFEAHKKKKLSSTLKPSFFFLLLFLILCVLQFYRKTTVEPTLCLRTYPEYTIR